MEQHFLTDTAIDDRGRQLMESQLRECFGRIVYSHKVHEKDADRYFHRLRVLKVVEIFLSAITTGGLIVTLVGEGKLAAAIAAVSSAILLGLTFYTKDHDLGTLAQKHSDTATRLWSIRESYFSLLTDLRAHNLSLLDASSRREELQGALEAVYLHAPRTSSAAYKKAQRALQSEEELTFSDKEIDVFLPRPLRMSERAIEAENPDNSA